MTLALRYTAVSDVGRVRKNNQDSGFASEQLLVVADGMGGAAAGDLASSVTVQTMRRLHGRPVEDMLEALAGAVQRANDRLGDLVEEDPSVEGMGTTVTAMLFDGSRIGMAHIGDSRAYLLRDGTLEQLTQDHTFVQSLVDEGNISEAEARTHPHRSLLLRALDGRHDTEPDLTTFEAHAGDRLLLCSDGLSGVLDQDTMRQALGDGGLDHAGIALLRLALDAGGPDNITCVLGDVVDVDTPVDPESAAVATGPMLVGSAAEQPRGRMGGDTASQPAIDAEAGDADAGGGGRDDHEALRYAPRPPRRFRWLRRIAVLVVVAAVLALSARFAYGWTQEQYYVADNGDHVAIYRGIEADVPLLTLSSLHMQSTLELSALPGYWRNRVMEGIEATGLGGAHNIVGELTDAARACAEESRRPRSTPPPSPSPSPSSSPSPSPGSTSPRPTSPGPTSPGSTSPGPTSPGPTSPSASPSQRADPGPLPSRTTVTDDPTGGTGDPTGGALPDDPSCAGAT